MTARLLPCGEHAVLVEVDGLQEVLALDDAVRAAVSAGDPAFADVVDVVPAARTLLVVLGEGADLRPLREAMPTLALHRLTRRSSAVSGSASQGGPTGQGVPASQGGPTGQGVPASQGGPTGQGVPASKGVPASRGVPAEIEIRVHYDGPDLEEVGKLTGLSAREVVDAHTQTPWRVAFSGFAPGFAYLCGGDSRLQVPRRDEPRTSVPAGSVGLAGEFSAVYPRSSPGGWQLLGRTEALLWDVGREPAALLQPGSVVRFVDAGNSTNDDSTNDNSTNTDPQTSAELASP